MRTPLSPDVLVIMNVVTNETEAMGTRMEWICVGLITSMVVRVTVFPMTIFPMTSVVRIIMAARQILHLD